MKSFGLAKMLVFAVLAIAFSAVLCVTGFAYDDAQNVAFVNGQYQVTGEETLTQGKSAEFPFTSLFEAYSSLYETGGTVVVCGKTRLENWTVNSTAMKHSERIFFTSLFEGTDYAQTNDAQIIIVGAPHFAGDVTIENITIVTKQYAFIHANGFKLVFGEGINVVKGTAAHENYKDSTTGEYADTTQNLVVRSGGEGRAYDRDLYLEFNGGLFSAIHAGTKGHSINGDVNVIVNIPQISSINLGNDVAKDSSGNATYHKYMGDVNVTVNANTSITFSLSYIEQVCGSMNFALNNGAECVTNFSLVPDNGIYIVSADENGRVETLGGGRFRAVADEGYIAVVPMGAKNVSIDSSFAQMFEFDATVRETTVAFVDRANKPAPTGLYSIPASDYDATDGEIHGVTIAMEYRLEGQTDFIAASSSIISGLAPGVYEIRYKAENGYDAGEITKITVSGRSAEVVVREALEAREAKIREVRSSTSSLNPADYANVYYVSTSGVDRADDGENVYGKSADTPYKTVAYATSKAVAGDLVLLKRGDIWREHISLKSGVDYSSYGDASLPMPFIYGSPENGADPSKWTLVEGTDNIWLYEKELTDVGVLVFNEGEENSLKEIPDYYDGTYYVRGTKKAEEFNFLTHLDRDLEHFNLYTAGQSTVYIPKLTSSKLYLRCDRGNPGEVFDSIEFNTTGNVVKNAIDCHFDNIGIKYGGAHGIGGGASKDFTVTNCEIGWIGGVVQYYKKSTAGEFGAVTRYGNGIEIWQNCDGFRVEDCYVYQCYDAGLTHQGRASNTETDVPNESYMKNVYFCNNLLEYNVYNIEYFMSNVVDAEAYENAGYDYPMMTNINYTGNLCFYAGYGFGKQRPDAGRMCHINGWSHGNPANGFNISGNTFFDSVDYVAYMGAQDEESLPVFGGNTYIQKRGTYGAYYGQSSSMSRVIFDEGIHQFYESAMGDNQQEVIFIEVLNDELRAVRDEAAQKLYITGIDEYTAVSFDGGVTWQQPETDAAEFSIDKLTEKGVLVKAVSRARNSMESEAVVLELLPADDGFTVSASYNLLRNSQDSYIKDAQSGFNNCAVITIVDEAGNVVATHYENVENLYAQTNGLAVISIARTISPGTYKLVFTKNGYAESVTDFVIETSNVDLGTISPVGGDVRNSYKQRVGDGVVDVDDFLIVLRGLYNDADENLRLTVDINEDGTVSADDFDIIKTALASN